MDKLNFKDKYIKYKDKYIKLKSGSREYIILSTARNSCELIRDIVSQREYEDVPTKQESETIYSYLNRKSKEYILQLIPDLKIRVDELDEKIIILINTYLTHEEKDYFDYQLQQNNKEKYDFILSKINELVKNFYLSLSTEIIRFQTEFVPLFLQNYKRLIDYYMIQDILTLKEYNNYISDKNSDKFMVETKPYEENKIYVNIKLDSIYDIKINNLCEWHNTKEYCSFKPINPSLKYQELHKDLLPYFFSQWIYHYSKLTLYSDVSNNNLESGNILSLNLKTNNYIEFKFSKFSSDNTITNLLLDTIFNNNNPFKIKIFNPLNIYIESLVSMINSNEEEKKFKELLINHHINDDKRLKDYIHNFFNIKSLTEACKILHILLNGDTITYNKSSNSYISSSNNILNFNNTNGISNKCNYGKDVHETLTI